MKITKVMLLFLLSMGIGFCCLFQVSPARAAASDVSVPAILQDGFNVWAKKGASTYAFDVWKKGGLLEADKKPTTLTAYFNRLDRTVGNYKGFEFIEGKRISPSSEIIYISIKFERATVYGRYLVYLTEKGWVVQNMDFSLKPEAIMPWLAFAGETYSE